MFPYSKYSGPEFQLLRAGLFLRRFCGLKENLQYVKCMYESDERTQKI